MSSSTNYPQLPATLGGLMIHITLFLEYKYLLCLTVPSYAQHFIYTTLNHTCTSVTGFVYVRHKGLI